MTQPKIRDTFINESFCSYLVEAFERNFLDPERSLSPQLSAQGFFLQVPAMPDEVIPVVELLRLKSVIFNGLTNDELLTPFERSFLMDFAAKFDQYGRRTFVSGKQDEQFNRIERLLQDELGNGYKTVT